MGFKNIICLNCCYSFLNVIKTDKVHELDTPHSKTDKTVPVLDSDWLNHVRC